MPLLTAVNLVVAHGTRRVLDGATISIEPGERIGLVGRNGTGKTTLMRVLAGLTAADAGTVSMSRGPRAGYLMQDPEFDPDETLRQAAEGAFAELHRLHGELDRVYERMASASGDDLARLMREQERLERAMEAAGGYAIEHRIESVLHGLGFTDAQFSIPTRALSGGQRGRLALARLLLEAPDLLLLDEPTNHLDIEGRRWLEDYLTTEYRGAVLVVSHDRYLLDRVVTRIVEVEQGRLIDYPGNYEDFRELRAERRLAQARAYENQQAIFRKEEAYIRRYKAGQRAKQARGRQTRLERAKDESTLERPMELATLDFEFPRGPRTGEVVISANGLRKAYRAEDGTEKVLFSGFKVQIGRGERWGIIGPNGAGKTTLARCLLGEVEPDEGTSRLGSNVRVGHYRQTHEHVDPGLRVHEFLQRAILRENPGQPMSEQQARNLAGAFLFSGPEQDRLMGQLSGGERSRAVLAALLASAKNVLVLDEPTNHLDIPSAERLEDALAGDGDDGRRTGYDGVLILISHDRALIDATCDHLIVLDGKGGAAIFHGGYTLWHEREEARRREEERERVEAQRRRDEADRKRRAAEEARRQERQAVRATAGAHARLRTEQLEARIEAIEERLKAIDEELADPGVWRDPARSAALNDERARLTAELEPLEFEWARRADEG